MRAHKGLGKAKARAIRLEKDAAHASDKAKHISPFHVRKSMRVAKVAIHREKKIVLQSEVNAAFVGLGSANRQPTGKQKRKMLQQLRTEE